jgi:hypothetical protein
MAIGRYSQSLSFAGKLILLPNLLYFLCVRAVKMASFTHRTTPIFGLLLTVCVCARTPPYPPIERGRTGCGPRL